MLALLDGRFMVTWTDEVIGGIQGMIFDPRLTDVAWTGTSLDEYFVGTVYNAGDTLDGGAGNDTLVGGLGADSLVGGAGTADIASYFNATAGVRADLTSPGTNTSDAQGDTYSADRETWPDRTRPTRWAATARPTTSRAAAAMMRSTVAAGRIRWTAALAMTPGRRNRGRQPDRRRRHARPCFVLDGGNGLRAVLIAPGGNTGDAAGDTYSGVEDLGGTQFNDVLGGDNGANQLSGGNGNDDMDGLQGADSLYGGAGNDRLIGGAGGDVLDGGGAPMTAPATGTAQRCGPTLPSPPPTRAMRWATATSASRTCKVPFQ